MKKLEAVQSGDVVALVAPSSHFKKEDFLAGVSVLSGQDWMVQYRSDIFAKHLYFSGDDDRRAAELMDALCDPSIRAVLFARGGYGAMRLLPFLSRIKKTPAPKIVAGFSDATAILSFVQKKWGWPVFYAPSVNSFSHANITAASVKSFFAQLSGRQVYPYSVGSLRVLCPGKAQGRLVGGCLSLISNLVGTPFEIDTKDAILFLEDVGEEPYAIDRMLTHLRLAGKFETLRGMIWGSISAKKPKKDYLVTFKSVFANDHFPILYDFPAGHQKQRVTFPLGCNVAMDSKTRSVRFLESPFV